MIQNAIAVKVQATVMILDDGLMLYQYNHNQHEINPGLVGLDTLPHVQPAGTWIATLTTYSPDALLGTFGIF